MAQLPEHAKDKAIEIWFQTKPASVSKVHEPAFGPDGERDRARHATNATSGLTFLAPSVRNAALRRRSSYPPPIPMQCPCIWPKSAAASRRERMRRSSSMGQAITSRRDSPFHPTSRSSACPRHHRVRKLRRHRRQILCRVALFRRRPRRCRLNHIQNLSDGHSLRPLV
jgi:hypothetical protein